MRRLHRILSALLLSACFGAYLAATGCNTVHGLGQDVERAGEKTQDAADSVKRRL